MNAATWWRRLRGQFFVLRAASHRHFGNLYGDPEAYRAAIGDLTRAIELDPTNVRALVMRGTLYWRELRDTERAIRDLGRAWELDGSCWEALMNRALARQDAGDWAGALADLEHYVQYAPADSWKASAERLRQELRSR